MKTYRVIEKMDNGSDASANVVAKSPLDAARKCHKSAKDVKSGRVRVELAQPYQHQETGYAQFD